MPETPAEPSGPVLVSPAPGPWRPSSSAQWVGVVVAVVWCGLLAFGLPWLADVTAPKDEVLEAGARVEGGGVSVVPPEGWTWDALSTGLLKLTKSDASVLFFPPAEATQDPSVAIGATVDIFRGDTATAYDIGEPQAFTTDSGKDGLSVVILAPESATVVYLVSDGSNQSQAQMNASYATWDDLGPEVDDMMATLEFTDGGAA